MLVLVYGFERLAKDEGNITLEVLEVLEGSAHVKTVAFPVKFSQKMFLDVLKRERPDVIVGLGQHPRGKQLRIERKARNVKQDSYDKQVKRIAAKGPDDRLLSLVIPQDSKSWHSYDAGVYVCNYSMYVISGFAQKHGIPFGFLHVPKGYDARKCAEYVRRLVRGFASQTSLKSF